MVLLFSCWIRITYSSSSLLFSGRRERVFMLSLVESFGRGLKINLLNSIWDYSIIEVFCETAVSFLSFSSSTITSTHFPLFFCSSGCLCCVGQSISGKSMSGKTPMPVCLKLLKFYNLQDMFENVKLSGNFGSYCSCGGGIESENL